MSFLNAIFGWLGTMIGTDSLSFEVSFVNYCLMMFQLTTGDDVGIFWHSVVARKIIHTFGILDGRGRRGSRRCCGTFGSQNGRQWIRSIPKTYFCKYATFICKCNQDSLSNSLIGTMHDVLFKLIDVFHRPGAKLSQRMPFAALQTLVPLAFNLEVLDSWLLRDERILSKLYGTPSYPEVSVVF